LPHHKQYEKTLRQDAKRRLVNRSKRARLRHAVREFRAETDPQKAAKLLPAVSAILDKSAKTHLIHPRTANRLKSRLALALQRISAGKAA
jgi:ribosomal protein S20